MERYQLETDGPAPGVSMGSSAGVCEPSGIPYSSTAMRAGIKRGGSRRAPPEAAALSQRTSSSSTVCASSVSCTSGTSSRSSGL